MDLGSLKQLRFLVEAMGPYYVLAAVTMLSKVIIRWKWYVVLLRDNPWWRQQHRMSSNFPLSILKGGLIITTITVYKRQFSCKNLGKNIFCTLDFFINCSDPYESF